MKTKINALLLKILHSMKHDELKCLCKTQHIFITIYIVHIIKEKHHSRTSETIFKLDIDVGTL